MVAGGLEKEASILSYTNPLVSYLFCGPYSILWPELNSSLKLGVDQNYSKMPSLV